MSFLARRFGRTRPSRGTIAAALAGVSLLSAACGPADGGPTHEIELEHVLTLEGVGDSIDLSTTMPARSRNGFIAIVLDDAPSNAVGLYDSTGRFVRRFGRSGRGPGEFRAAQQVGFGPGDSLWVLDQAFLAHVFSPPPASEYVRTIQPGRPLVGRITPWGILSAGVFTSPGGLRHPHVMGFDGQLRWEFGADVPPKDIHDRMASPGMRDSAHVWVAHAKAYILELLGADGAVHGRVERTVAWMPGDTSNLDRRIPRGSIRAVSVDAEGLLCVLGRRANPEYVPPTGPPLVANRPIEARRLPTFSYAERFEGVIEVLDPRDGRLVASRVVSGGVLGFAERDLIHEVEQDEVGRVKVHLRRMRLRELRADPAARTPAALP